MPGVTGRLLRPRLLSWRSLAAAATAAVVIFVGVRLSEGGGAGGLATFNTCITQTRFLVLVRQPHGQAIIETIDDRRRGDVVGEVAHAHGPTLVGAAAGTDRYTMSTATPLGPDATAIEQCWDAFSPVA